MMAFLLFLIVFAINYNTGMTRSVSGIDTHNRINSGEHTRLGDIYNLPTVIKPGFRITIKGRLKPTDKLFKVVLRGNQETNENGVITYDFGSETITVTSAEESASEMYVLLGQKEETFSLRITARTNKIVVVDFEVNQLAPSSPVFWDIGDLRNIKYIEVQKGVEHTDSLLFELLKSNR